MNRKNTIRLTESELKRVINESVKKILSEMQEYTFDDIVMQCAPLYQEVEKLYHTINTTNNIPQKFVESFKNHIENNLKIIAQKINTFYGQDVVTVGYHDYDEYDDYLTLVPSNDMNGFTEEEINTLLNAMFKGISFTQEQETANAREKEYQSQSKQNEINSYRREYGDYDKAYYSSDFGDLQSPSNYGYKIQEKPKIVGKINLPKENDKATLRRRNALNK
jgi:hypothetical protein